MKKVFLLFLFFVPALFLSCEMFGTDIIAFLDYYTNSAAIEIVNYDGDYPIANSKTNLPATSGDKVINFTMRNPKSYVLDIEVEWNEEIVDAFSPVTNDPGNNDYTIVQTEPSIITLTLLESFLQEIDNSQEDGIDEISATIHLTESGTGRDFESFTFEVIVNSPPPMPSPVALVKNIAEDNWFLALDVLTLAERMGLHHDISAIIINNIRYTLSITNGILNVDSRLMTEDPSGGNPFTDAYNQVFSHSAGNTIWLNTATSKEEEITYQIAYEDSRGIVSPTATVKSSGSLITDYFVTEDASSTGKGTAGDPFDTVQKAVEAIYLAYDENTTYTVHISGSVEGGNGNATNSVYITKGNIIITGNGQITPSGKRIMFVGGGAQVTLEERVTLTGATLNDYGVGLTIGGVGTLVTMRDYAKISGNTAYNNNGGGVYISDGSLIMQDYSEIQGNRSIANPLNNASSVFHAKGGGVYIASGSLTMQDNSKIWGNATYGSNGADGADGKHGNQIDDDLDGGDGEPGVAGGNAEGGGVYIDTDGSLTLEDDCKIYDNEAKAGDSGDSGDGGDGEWAFVTGLGGQAYPGTNGGSASGGGVYAQRIDQIIGGNMEVVITENTNENGTGGAGGKWGDMPGIVPLEGPQMPNGSAGTGTGPNWFPL